MEYSFLEGICFYLWLQALKGRRTVWTSCGTFNKVFTLRLLVTTPDLGVRSASS